MQRSDDEAPPTALILAKLLLIVRTASTFSIILVMQLQAKAPKVQKQDALNRLSCTLLVHGYVSSSPLPLLFFSLSLPLSTAISESPIAIAD